MSHALQAGELEDVARLPHDAATLIAAIGERAAASPDAVAIVDAARSISYAELADRTNAVAAFLEARGIAPGMAVGVCTERSASLVVVMLGVMAARATYVPLDPALPSARLATMCATANVELVVADPQHLERFGHVATSPLDDVAATTSSPRSREPALLPVSSDVAYVVFTSGSTGVPKGIAVRHDALANVARATRDRLGITADDRWLFRSSIGFDVAFGELATPLAAGAALVVAPDAIGANPSALVDLIVDRAVTAIFVVPTLLRALVEESRFDAGSVRIVTCAGEALGAALQRRFFERSRAQLWNLYGPSETTVWVTMHRCDPAIAVSPDASVPLGTAIANTSVTVRDARLEPLPVGVAGEIVVAGTALAVGYLGLPAETAARFPVDPSDPAGARCYRTGDAGRLRADGLLDYLGRRDDQLKIRGVRIEPLEIVAALERLAAVHQAAVVARRRHEHGDPADVVLVAYVVPDTVPLDEHAVRHELAATLPRAMIPSVIRTLDALPLTPNGKIDAQRLRALPLGDVDETVRTESRLRASEQRVLAIWHALLGPTTIGADEDFFDVGGDSLLALQLMERIEREFSCSVELAAFIASPTVRGLARLVRLRDDELSPIRGTLRFNETGTRPPLVLLHGDFGGGNYVRRIAARLGADQPVVSFAPHGADASFVPATVEEMADEFVARIERLYPLGALRLAGYSFAGTVALEVARKLKAQGRDVDRVIVVGGDPTNVKFAWVKRLARRIGLSPLTVRRRTHALRIRLGRAKSSPVQSPDSIVSRAPFRAYIAATENFIPRYFDGHVHLVWPEDQRSAWGGDARELWLEIACSVSVAPVTGDHYSTIARHVVPLADAISEELMRTR